MQPLSKEQFKRKYLQGHQELMIADKLRGGSLIKSSPGDKNIKSKKKIPGKDIIEKKAFENRADEFKHYLMDAVSVKGADILDMDLKDILNLVVKTLPTKTENKTEHTFTFADMVVKAKKVDTIDV